MSAAKRTSKKRLTVGDVLVLALLPAERVRRAPLLKAPRGRCRRGEARAVRVRPALPHRCPPSSPLGSRDFIVFFLRCIFVGLDSMRTLLRD